MAGRHELGEFLRTRRALVTPAMVGLESDVLGRRVSGLRREEVANLAGVSVDYYTRLEQGRHVTPSDAVLDAVARALALDDAGRAHLSDLARPSRSGVETPKKQKVRAAVRQMVESFDDHPAFVLGRRTDVLVANPLARGLIADWSAMPARDRNYTRWIILDPAARDIHLDWDKVAADVVGTLRVDAGRHPEDPLLNELVGELTIKSREFRSWWSDHRVHVRTHGTKRMQHPVVGPITINFEAFALPGDADQTLFVYTTDPGSRSEENLRLLASWIRQPFDTDAAGSAVAAPDVEHDQH